jgi:hypothetical protein
MALPPEVRSELDRRLIKSAFSGYEQLAQWLQEQGFEIAKPSVHRYGSGLQHEVEESKRVLRQAKAVVEAVPLPEDVDAIMDATLQLIQRRLLDMLLEADRFEQGDLARLTHIATELSRTTIARQRWEEELGKIKDAEAEAAVQDSHRRGFMLNYLTAATSGDGDTSRLLAAKPSTPSARPQPPTANRNPDSEK